MEFLKKFILWINPAVSFADCSNSFLQGFLLGIPPKVPSRDAPRGPLLGFIEKFLLGIIPEVSSGNFSRSSLRGFVPLRIPPEVSSGIVPKIFLGIF